VDTTINDLTQSAVVRVIATHNYDEIMAGIRDESLTQTLTKATRRELRQFGVHVTRCKLLDFADCKGFKLLTSQVDRQGMATHQFDQQSAQDLKASPPCPFCLALRRIISMVTEKAIRADTNTGEIAPERHGRSYWEAAR
jgi:hypothetical protein